MPKHIAIYVRVSSAQQSTRSQLPDMERWAAAQEEQVKWYTDKASGGTMQRPEWDKLEDAVRTGRVSSICCWRLDRLGRTAKGLTALFDDLRERKVNLVSIKDGLDLSTPAGRLMANVLASVAQYETEVRGERVLAGQAVARAKGKTWGGSTAGVRKTITPEKILAIKQLHEAGTPILRIAKTVAVARQSVYDVLKKG